MHKRETFALVFLLICETWMLRANLRNVKMNWTISWIASFTFISYLENGYYKKNTFSFSFNLVLSILHRMILLNCRNTTNFIVYCNTLPYLNAHICALKASSFWWTFCYTFRRNNFLLHQTFRLLLFPRYHYPRYIPLLQNGKYPSVNCLIVLREGLINLAWNLRYLATN